MFPSYCLLRSCNFQAFFPSLYFIFARGMKTKLVSSPLSLHLHYLNFHSICPSLSTCHLLYVPSFCPGRKLTFFNPVFFSFLSIPISSIPRRITCCLHLICFSTRMKKKMVFLPFPSPLFPLILSCLPLIPL